MSTAIPPARALPSLATPVTPTRKSTSNHLSRYEIQLNRMLARAFAAKTSESFEASLLVSGNRDIGGIILSYCDASLPHYPRRLEQIVVGLFARQHKFATIQHMPDSVVDLSLEYYSSPTLDDLMEMERKENHRAARFNIILHVPAQKGIFVDWWFWIINNPLTPEDNEIIERRIIDYKQMIRSREVTNLPSYRAAPEHVTKVVKLQHILGEILHIRINVSGISEATLGYAEKRIQHYVSPPRRGRVVDPATSAYWKIAYATIPQDASLIAEHSKNANLYRILI